MGVYSFIVVLGVNSFSTLPCLIDKPSIRNVSFKRLASRRFSLNVPVDCVVNKVGEVAPLREVYDTVLGRAGVAVMVARPCVFGLSRAFDFSRRSSLQLAHRFF